MDSWRQLQSRIQKWYKPDPFLTLTEPAPAAASIPSLPLRVFLCP